MSELDIVPAGTPPEPVLRCEPQIYNILLNVALGASVVQACRNVSITRKTYYGWLNKYPDWMAGVRARAVADAIELYRVRANEAMLAKVSAQFSMEQLVLKEAPGLLEQVIEDTKHEDASFSYRLRVLEQLTTLVKHGFYASPPPVEVLSEPATQEEYNAVNLLDAMIVLPDGTVLEVPEGDTGLRPSQVDDEQGRGQDGQQPQCEVDPERTPDQGGGGEQDEDVAP